MPVFPGFFEIIRVVKTKKMIKKAIDKQLNGEGFCLVEVLSACPTNWNLSPTDALGYMRDVQEKYFELGEFTDRGGYEKWLR